MSTRSRSEEVTKEKRKTNKVCVHEKVTTVDNWSLNMLGNLWKTMWNRLPKDWELWVAEAETFIHRSHPSLVEFVSDGMNSPILPCGDCVWQTQLPCWIKPSAREKDRHRCLSWEANRGWKLSLFAAASKLNLTKETWDRVSTVSAPHLVFHLEGA